MKNELAFLPVNPSPNHFSSFSAAYLRLVESNWALVGVAVMLATDGVILWLIIR